jgi:hypothetical protein
MTDTAMAPALPASSGLVHRLASRRLPGIEAAWPWDWENRPEKDGCRHEWEIVVVARLFDPKERVARCARCHTPRCGYAEDTEPCDRRRHHDGEHVTGRRARE